MIHRIYRLEISNKLIDGTLIGRGVYVNCPFSSEILNDMYNKHRNNITNPGMRDDFPLDELNDSLYNYSCACLTLKQLKTWFDGFLEELIKLGCDIVEYEVSNVVKGISNKQCFFKNDNIISKKIITNKLGY